RHRAGADAAERERNLSERPTVERARGPHYESPGVTEIATPSRRSAASDSRAWFRSPSHGCPSVDPRSVWYGRNVEASHRTVASYARIKRNTSMELAGKVALVTGGSGDIGGAIGAPVGPRRRTRRRHLRRRRRCRGDDRARHRVGRRPRERAFRPRLGGADRDVRQRHLGATPFLWVYSCPQSCPTLGAAWAGRHGTMPDDIQE